MRLENALNAMKRTARDAVGFDVERVMEAIRRNPEHVAFIISNVVGTAVDDVVEELAEVGYVRVSDDPATVERVAKAIFARQFLAQPVPITYDGWLDEAWGAEPPEGQDEYRADAAAAIAALKGNNDA